MVYRQRRPAPASIAEAARQAGCSSVTRFRAAYRERYGRDPALPAQAAGTVPSSAGAAGNPVKTGAAGGQDG